MRRFEITAHTMAQQNPSPVDARKPYYFQGDPTWTPNDPRYREKAPDRRGDFTSCGESQSTRREKRIRDFAAALASLGAENPATATNVQAIEAGKRVGVGEKTAMSYRALLRRRQGGVS